MAASGTVNVAFARCFILFIAVIILVEGVVYLGLSVWGLTQGSCSNLSTNITQDPLEFSIQSVYFTYEKCNEPNVTVGAIPEPIVINVDWSETFKITHREFIFMWTYAAVSLTWVLTSLLVIFSICVPASRDLTAAIYWPWFLLIIAGCILDVIATYYHASDISNTTTIDNTFKYIGFSVPPEYMEELENYSTYFVIPAIIMTCISCRVVIIWLLNVFGASFCLSLSRILTDQQKPKNEPIKFTSATAVPATAPITAATNAESTVNAVPSEPVFQHPIYAEPYPKQIRPKPLPILTPAEPLTQQQQQQQQQDLNNHTTMQTSTLIPVANSSTASPSEQTTEPEEPRLIIPVAPFDTTYRTTDAHPNHLNYPDQATPAQQAVAAMAITPMNARYNECMQYPQNQSTPNNQRVSQELRGQLPWSYTSILKKPPPTPRKPQQQIQIYPHIPEPDYGD